MYKLLPESTKKEIKQEYVLRQLAVLTAGFLFILLVGIMALVPSYLISSSRLSEAKARTEVANTERDDGSADELLEWLSTTNKKLSILASGIGGDLPTKHFSRFLEQNYDGITVSDVSWKSVDESATVVVSGLAQDRQKLIAFEREINSLGQFERFSVPISQLARERNIEFQVTLVPLMLENSR